MIERDREGGGKIARPWFRQQCADEYVKGTAFAVLLDDPKLDKGDLIHIRNMAKRLGYVK